MMQKHGSLFLVIFFLELAYFSVGNAQESNSTAQKPYLYRPNNLPVQDSIVQTNTSAYGLYESEEYKNALLKQKQDSIFARELYVKDSLLKRQIMVDSLNFLKTEIPFLLFAGLLTQLEQIIVEHSSVSIIGDSMLSNFTYIFFPLSFNQPYTPWITTINLSSKSFNIQIDTINHQIVSIKAPQINWTFSRNINSTVLRIEQPSIVSQKNGKKYYKQPIDSVFFDSNGRINKIKRYANIFLSNENYQKGSFLFCDLYRVKQFEYNNAGELVNFELVNFIERWNKTDASKISTICRYTLNKQLNKNSVQRMNNPPNEYSDGTFNYEFDLAHNLKLVSFKNLKNTENWKTTIELNELGFVKRYVYEVNGHINSTLLINYFPEAAPSKHRFETITCTFENDGISYYQKNNTTGESRVRDKFTGEWSSWE